MIELLVVIVVICILMAVLLPAVLMSREAARRCHCANNLGQLIVAVQTYENIHEVLPPGTVNDTGPIANVPIGYHHGWLTQILPYIGRSDVARNLNPSRGVYDGANQTCRRILIGVMLCPSAPGNAHREVDGVASSSYAGNHHNVEAPIAESNNGIFFLNSRVRYDDIPDGTSNTIFIGEKAPSTGELGWASGTRATLRNAGGYVPIKLGVNRWVTRIPEPGSSGPNSSDDPGATSDPVGGFGSVHSNVVNFAFGDGSVRAISGSISPLVFRALSSRAGGELPDDGAF